MRIGGFFSMMAHGAIVATGLLAAPSGSSGDAEMMTIIDIDLVTLADETNIAPVTKDAEEDEVAEEAEQEEFASATAPPPKPEDTIALDEPEARPPPKPKEESAEEALNKILAGIPEEKKRATPASQGKGTNLNNVPDAGPRPGAGRRTGNSATMAAIIASQLVTNKCWTDHSDMADAHRLSATFRVRFGRNGRFLSEPQMIDPTRPPSSDLPLQVYIQYGITALNKCNTSFGFRVPPAYFDLPTNEQYLDLRLLPQVAAMR